MLLHKYAINPVHLYLTHSEINFQIGMVASLVNAIVSNYVIVMLIVASDILNAILSYQH